MDIDVKRIQLMNFNRLKPGSSLNAYSYNAMSDMLINGVNVNNDNIFLLKDAIESLDSVAMLDRIVALEEMLPKVFQYVSNGKLMLASAITDKGVETEPDATFETMCDNIYAIQTGAPEPVTTATYEKCANASLYAEAEQRVSTAYTTFNVSIKQDVIKLTLIPNVFSTTASISNVEYKEALKTQCSIISERFNSTCETSVTACIYEEGV